MKRRRTNEAVAHRAAIIAGMARANPYLTYREIGKAVGLTSDGVGYHLRGESKAPEAWNPWGDTFKRLCTALAAKDTEQAAIYAAMLSLDVKKTQ